MPKLKDAVAVVTGGSSGIGAAIATLFASEGAAVAIVAREIDAEARELLAAIEQDGGRAIAIAADVGEADAVAAAFSQVAAAFGPATILVNSAGVDASGIPVADMPLEQFEAVLRTNLIGPFLCVKAFIGAVPEGSRTRIINISSVHEDLPRAGAADYCASKGGLRNLTRCLALELAPRGITVNNLAPGMVLTPMNQEAIDDPAKLAEQVASIPLKRAAEPREVAELALYIASADGAYATGATFTLDGGLTCNIGQGA